ncbi:MBL fold metallo-hydrolase [Chitinibacteraceae bacterium HSL-7]
MPQHAHTLTVQLVRSATIKLDYGDLALLVDPMLAAQHAYAGLPGTRNSHLRYPTSALTMPVDEAIRVDAVIVTHTHPDHWDEAARALLPRDMPLFAQHPADAAAIGADGFSDVRLLDEGAHFGPVRLRRTGGQHGSDAIMAVIGDRLGEVCGVVFERDGYPTVYVAGDTVWHDEVERAIARYRPDVIVLNAGYAQIDGMDGAIIMGKEDLERAHRLAPHATVLAVHVDAVNHGMQDRGDLAGFIAARGLPPERVRVPANGERCVF